MVDWLIAIDDVLTERHRRCTACGRALATNIRFGIWETHGMALATLLCAKCRQVDPDAQTIARVMEARYGTAQADTMYS
jgi:hypothetical protein